MPERVVIIGAGIGGLTAGAVLAAAGRDVTVLEAHVYPGGCAGTFYHQGYRFDAGATLAGGFYPGGPMDRVAQATGIDRWPTHPTNHAMSVHLPDGRRIERVSGNERWRMRREAFGNQADAFWQWQENAADALWDLALRGPAWPPQTPADAANVLRHGASWLARDPRRLSPALLADAFRPVAAHLRRAPAGLRQFVDGQLLIAAQTTSAHANALYGAAALDLPRRGIVHLTGGMGGLATALAQAIQRHGGRVLYRQEASRILRQPRQPIIVATKSGGRFTADVVIANLTPWNIAALLGDDLPRPLRRLPSQPRTGWGAFMLYVGLDEQAVPNGGPLHHQVITGEPLGEGNSLFLSLSPGWDANRAPDGQRALTISTHTELSPWWQLFHGDRAAYESRKRQYTEHILAAAEVALPGLRDAARLILPGTPITFQRFTRRVWGWVGGFPQTSLFQAWGPRLTPNMWLVGDTIFPGQSTAATALGGLRVAQAILRSTGQPSPRPQAAPPVHQLHPSGD